ncbi:site-specific DNA-methyltransferase [Parasphingorhabdus sp.]|uniref:site-specific DNA-methyltransferase n=1 Tax=Parasphingorhabdus sp. TaxID=2709688 RepID=UPI003002DBFB
MKPSTDIAALELVYLSPDCIKPYSDNPRAHPDQQISMIATSIETFNFNNPVLITPDHMLIAGHGRLLAAQRLGVDAIPAIILPHLSEAEQRAYRIADNAIMLKGEWSLELLASELEFVTRVAFDISPDAIGFETGQIDFIIGRNSNDSEGGLDADEEISDPDRSEPPVSRPGDIWRIGRHSVICGDARSPDVYEQLLGGKKADAVISDMPWNVPYSGHIGGLGNVHHEEFMMASGEMSSAEFSGFMQTVLEQQALVSKPGALHFQFIDWRSVADMIRAGEGVYDALVNLCVWVKPNGGMGSLWRSRHELVCVFRTKGGKHQNNVMLGKHGRNRTNVWEYAGANSFRSDRMKDLEAHPTCKPVDMIADAIMDCTNRNDLVLDAFLGSGTTVMAAERTGRTGLGIELDPHYVDVAIQRIAEVTGSLPILSDGRSYDEVRSDRAAEAQNASHNERET